ncbi:MAG: DoxX family protein [Chloroflexota bacterium]
MNLTLWILQAVLALFFALASGMPKLLLPAEALPMPIAIPGLLLTCIGVAEVLGGLGLIVPAVTRTQTWLVPLAAAGLVLVTVGATTYQLVAGELANALFAVTVGLLCAFVGYGRWQLEPHRERPRRPSLELVR